MSERYEMSYSDNYLLMTVSWNDVKTKAERDALEEWKLLEVKAGIKREQLQLLVDVGVIDALNGTPRQRTALSSRQIFNCVEGEGREVGNGAYHNPFSGSTEGMGCVGHDCHSAKGLLDIV